MRRGLLTSILAVIGVGLLVWQVRDAGVTEIRGGFASVGWGFAAILALSFARFVLRSLAWTALSLEPLPLWAAVRATLSGDALGNVTPLGLAASEPAKAMAVGHHVDAARALAALTAENFFYSVSVALYVMASATAMLVEYTLPDHVRWMGLLALGVMGAVLVGAVWLAWLRPSLLSDTARRVPVRSVQKLAGQLEAFERDAYLATSSGRITTVVVCQVLFHVISLIECWYTFRLLTGSTSWLAAFVFDGFSRVANIIFKIVPGRVGFEETGTKLLGIALGFPADRSLMLGIVRKARVLVWAAVGMTLYLSRRPSRSARKG